MDGVAEPKISVDRVNSGQVGGHPAGLILWRLLLLVGRLVGLVEYDQTELLELG